MNDFKWILYGANGYTGELVAREAVRRGMSPVLAGRRSEPVKILANQLGLESRCFSLDSPNLMGTALEGAAAVVHCAGPFMHTSAPMVSACLAAGVHYLDITGEIAVFETVLASGDHAKSAGVALLPGVGFDVVPSDCLAARLAQALPDATDLELAFTSEGGSFSRGTLKTVIEGLPHSGAVRRKGRIVTVPLAYRSKKIDFDCGPRWAMTIPWGDVSTAFHSTGIPNIKVYSATPPETIRRLRRVAKVLPLLGSSPAKAMLGWWIGRTVTGPNAAQRARARTYLWGRVTNSEGDGRLATMQIPEGYSFTASAAVECLRRVLEGHIEPGAWTPSSAFGSNFVDSLPGVLSKEVRSVQEAG